MSNNNKTNRNNNPDETSKLDKGIDIADPKASCGRCIRHLGKDFKIYNNTIYRCKECSILTDHWLNS